MRNVMRKFLVGSLQVAALIVFVTCIVIFTRAPPVPTGEAEDRALGEPNTDIQQVRVIRPDSETIQARVDSTGSLVARNVVAIIPQVSGVAEWVSSNLRTGGVFTAGEELYRIESADFELAVTQAKANLLVAEANLELREAESFAAIENWALLNPDTEAPSLVTRAPQIQQAMANIAVAVAQLEAAELNLSRTTFALPFDGRVLNTQVGEGQLLARGQAIATVYDKSSIEVQVPVSSSELTRLQPVVGRSAMIYQNGTRLEATVERLASAVEERSRSTSLYLVFDSPKELVPGTFVTVEIQGRSRPDSFRLPEQVEQPNSTLWVVREGVLQPLPLEIYERRSKELIVPAFEYFDGIVAGTLAEAYPGMPVTVTVQP